MSFLFSIGLCIALGGKGVFRSMSFKAIEHNDAATTSLFSSLKPSSNFQKAFSKVASISLDDTRCGRAKSVLGRRKACRTECS